MQRPAFTYRRVSTLGQVDEGISLEAQALELASYCKSRPWPLVGEFEDAGRSARSMRRRPGLKAALDAVCEAKGVLVVYSLSRLARSIGDAVAILKRLQGAGADLAVVNMQVDTTTPGGKLIYHILMAIAEFESEQTGERVKGAHAHLRKKHGRNVISPVRYGWTREKGRAGEHKPQPVPAEQATLKLIRSWRSEPTRPYTWIAVQLNARQIPAPGGGQWNGRSVCRVVG